MDGIGRTVFIELDLNVPASYHNMEILDATKDGIESSFGLVKQPETHGVAERFDRILKERVIEGRVFRIVEEVSEALGAR